jgi:hypothetical protein
MIRRIAVTVALVTSACGTGRTDLPPVVAQRKQPEVVVRAQEGDESQPMGPPALDRFIDRAALDDLPAVIARYREHAPAAR